ncbi:DedA family protein [Mergibacter septicus]|uniref:DedA family protein n=1 Tax=Mergibacter septicus TaxID=221402 RepID=A0A8D4LLM0_9PAST|nr:DedA family protein [Mergibacter septicus]AWX14767.1 DedA family protein [Mergibacter septicus]QDJ14018.1 DedA family protein [Mergibacter septicus]UTU48533.1 DedA family protein [Mergibacter septicus]WMR95838.1 DedA family protein [Mergibacter septicus]
MQTLIEFFSEYGYIAVFLVLIICGFGVPIPEDITLVSGGIIAGLGYANPHMMLIVSMLGVLIGDSIMYWLGRIFGVKILRFRPLRRILKPKVMKLVREKFEKYGSRVLFFARFLPGLRAPIYMVSGITRRVSYLHFLLMDFFAAIISVPIWVYLGHYGAHNLDWIKAQVHKGQAGIYFVIALVIIFILIKWLWNKYKDKKA